jgi:hypothetical protein
MIADRTDLAEILTMVIWAAGPPATRLPAGPVVRR